MFGLLVSLRALRKAKALSKVNIEAIDRQARAYGWQIGMTGQPLFEVVERLMVILF